MISSNSMLMIGSAGSNIGKTELACALLDKFGKNHNITAIKVTTIRDKDGQCPRGGRGCGVCSSLEGDYLITEETNNLSGKDTGRLLAAGAQRVFWLRVMKTKIREGIWTLLEKIGSESVVICESNSLRTVVEPGLFLIVDNPSLKVWKASAQEVRKYADRIVISCSPVQSEEKVRHNGFDSLLDEIKLSEGKWMLQEKATAIIMAGGNSRRMGFDKSQLLIDGQAIIKRIYHRLSHCFDQVFISANNREKFAFIGCKVVPDKEPQQGPLMGIASAIEVSANELNFITACDIPEINLRFIRRMLAEAERSGADIVVPVTGDGRHEPLFAIYRKSLLGTITRVLSSGGRKISSIFPLCKVKRIELIDADWLVNLNKPAEYEKYINGRDNNITFFKSTI
jgi:molybdopterin-guanine dinucleotide biosynthesis protein A